MSPALRCSWLIGYGTHGQIQRGRPWRTPATNGTNPFVFCTHFHQKAPEWDIGIPQMGLVPPTGNPGSTPAQDQES